MENIQPEPPAINPGVAGTKAARDEPSGAVDGHERLLASVAAELDDVLCTLDLCAHEPVLADRLWGQLVDLLVESAFLDLRRAHLAGELDRRSYVEEVGALAERCRAHGLVPLPARGQ